MNAEMNLTTKRKILRFGTAGVLFLLAGVLQYFDSLVPEKYWLYLNLGANLIFLGLCVFWLASLAERIVRRRIRTALVSVAVLFICLLLLKTIKYNFFESETVKRYLWYAFYIPLCLAPVAVFYMILSLNRGDDKPVPKTWCLLLASAVALILLVFTNDAHQFVFSFLPGFEACNDIYRRGTGYWLISGWLVLFSLIDVLLLFLKCRISHCRRKLWIPLSLFLACLVFCVLREVFDFNSYRTPETLTLVVVVLCESLIQIGLIPSNGNYARYFHLSDLTALISDTDYRVVLSSGRAPAVTREQLKQAERDAIFLDADSKFCGSAIGGGLVYWSEDVSVVNRYNRALAETGEALSEENELIAAENELREKQAKIVEKNRLYDGIARTVRPQVEQLNRIVGGAETKEERRDALRLALIYGAYIKRRSNLAVLEEKETGDLRELLYCIRESLNQLSFYGAACSSVCDGEGEIEYRAMICAYEFFEDCIERALPELSACFVRLSQSGGQITLRLSMEGAQRLVRQREALCGAWTRVGKVTVEEQEGTVYVTLRTGGGTERHDDGMA